MYLHIIEILEQDIIRLNYIKKQYKLIIKQLNFNQIMLLTITIKVPHILDLKTMIKLEQHLKKEFNLIENSLYLMLG
jgi:hypothetical protein